MFNRLILVALLLTVTTAAHAQIMGAGGAPPDAAANAAPRTSPRPRHDATLPARPAAERPPVAARKLPAQAEPAPKPTSAKPHAVKGR